MCSCRTTDSYAIHFVSSQAFTLLREWCLVLIHGMLYTNIFTLRLLLKTAEWVIVTMVYRRILFPISKRVTLWSPVSCGVKLHTALLVFQIRSQLTLLSGPRISTLTFDFFTPTSTIFNENVTWGIIQITKRPTITLIGNYISLYTPRMASITELE